VFENLHAANPMNNAPVIWCTKCLAGYGSTGDLPAVCPSCLQETRWTTTQPYQLSENDRRFLRSLRITSEEPSAFT
jgi:hypothetical protein